MKRVKILPILLAALLIISVIPTASAKTDAEALLNSVTFKPDHFLAKGSADYEYELKAGGTRNSMSGQNFLPEDADKLIVEAIEANTTEDMTNYQKVKAMYDFLIVQTTFKNNGYGTHQSIYSVLVRKTGSCYDFNYTMMAFLRYLGLNAYTVKGYTSRSGGGMVWHLWAEAVINGVAYVFDPQVEQNICGKRVPTTYYRFCKSYDEVGNNYKPESTDNKIIFASGAVSKTITGLMKSGRTLGDFTVEEEDLELLGYDPETMRFVGWYYDKELAEPIDPDKAVNRDITIWAKFVSRAFSDVSKSIWYYDSVMKVTLETIMTGVTEDTFAPKDSITREDFVRGLARVIYVGAGEYDGASTGFKDVDPDAAYAPFIAWALEAGITKGSGGGSFGVGKPATREEIAVFIYRFLNYLDRGFAPSPAATESFKDADSVSSWAVDAVEAMRLTGIFKGAKGYLNPKKNLTRAEAASLFVNLLEYLG